MSAVNAIEEQNLRDEEDKKRKELETERSNHAIRAAISQVMARNLSHNIGSHVMNNLIAGENLKDDLITKSDSYIGLVLPGDEHKELSILNQIAVFNNYVKCRMDYMSEVTFGVSTMQTNKQMFGEVFKNFDKVRLLLNHISGIDGFKYQICFKYNGNCSCFNNDIPVSFPSDILGCHAFYNILENII